MLGKQDAAEESRSRARHLCRCFAAAYPYTMADSSNVVEVEDDLQTVVMVNGKPHSPQAAYDGCYKLYHVRKIV